MNTSRGFAPLIVIIIVGLVILGGASWWIRISEMQGSVAVDPPWLFAGPSIKVTKVTNTTVEYEIVGQLPANTNVWLGLVDAKTGTEVWGMEGIQSTTGTIDLKRLDKFGTPISISPGEYFLLLKEFQSGKQIAGSSSVFTVP